MPVPTMIDDAAAISAAVGVGFDFLWVKGVISERGVIFDCFRSLV